ncbi:MAG: amino acid adenylation domain-containing protein, partial [Elusimicrobia bacterium]|nr:amino acid adenylation domain-containing protein [Elusimicrobiota bacterium]
MGRVSDDWNRTEAPFPRDATLSGLFGAQAAKTPDRTAVAGPGRRLSYGELDVLSGRIARAVRRRYREAAGAELPAGAPIGLFLERDADAVAAILGILKAGAAYVPLSPDYPEERLRALVRQAGVPLVVSSRALLPPGSALARLPAGAVLADPDSPDLDPAGSGPDWTGAGPGDAAYILHTSGSTGEPKGVICSHRGVVNIIHHMQTRYPLAEGDRCSLICSLTFDVSVYEQWSALLCGGCLCLPDRYTALSPELLFRYLHEHGVASAYIPPFFVEEFADFVEAGGLAAPVKRLLFGVEPIPEPLLARIKRALPSARVLNGYGPTEATVCCSLYEVDGTERDRRAPIGRPLSNTKLYVLDERLRPAAEGEPGELFVSGVGLASGYLREPGSGERRFLPNPFAPAAGEHAADYARLYRTGDLVVRRPCGNLEFLGRQDRQVKIRGVRVEPGEVEAVLARHPAVRACVVALVESGGEKKLAAYFTAASRDAAEPTPAQLRA